MSNKLLLLSKLYRASIELVTAAADHTHADVNLVEHMHRNSHILPAQTYFEGCWNQESCQMPTPSHPTLPPSWHHCKAMNHRCKKGLPHIHAWRHTPMGLWHLYCTSLSYKNVTRAEGGRGLWLLFCHWAHCITISVKVSHEGGQLKARQLLWTVQRVSAASRPGFLSSIFYFSQLFFSGLQYLVKFTDPNHFI